MTRADPPSDRHGGTPYHHQGALDAEVRTEQGKLYLLVAIDRTSKFAFVELHEKVARRTAADFLRHLIAAVPYKVHTVLTDNGTHFTTPGNTGSAAPDIRAAMEEL